MAVALALLLVSPALAQNLSGAVDDLRDHDVTFQRGAVTDQDIADLDRVATTLQREDAFFKIVVLAGMPTDFPSTEDFAQAVLRGLGGQGRVLVYDPQAAVIVSNVDAADAIARAEAATEETANRTDSFAEGAAAAGSVLLQGSAPVPQPPPVDAQPPAEKPGFGFSLGWLIPIVLIGAGAWWLFRSLRFRPTREDQAAETAVIGEGEKKVRVAVDRAANNVIELYERVNVPDAPAEAKQAYQAGSQLFIDTQKELEEADTRPELDAVYPKVLEAAWQLDTAKALLDGQPAPARPQPGPLFPAPAVPQPADAPVQVPAPSPAQPMPEPAPQPGGYRQFETSPWMTAAAMMAMQLLLGGGGSWGGRRDAMDDDTFDRQFSGGWGGGRGGGSSRGRPRINLGRWGGRGFGGGGGGGGGGRGF